LSLFSKLVEQSRLEDKNAPVCWTAL